MHENTERQRGEAERERERELAVRAREGGAGKERVRERALVGFNPMRVLSDRNHRVACTFDGGGGFEIERGWAREKREARRTRVVHVQT